MAKNWDKIGVLGCNSVIPRNVGEPPTGDGTAVGNGASAAAGSVAVGDGAAANHGSSVALGSQSATSKDGEASFGAPATESAAESTREVTHVSEPTAPSSAATKGYVDRINNIAPLNVGTAPSTPNDKSVAIGYGASCLGTDSAKVAFGAKANASGANACAFGPAAGAGGLTAIAEGLYANAPGDYGTAIGTNTLATGRRATAISSYSQAIDTGTIAINNSYAIGNTSVAIGYLSVTNAGQSLAIGSGAAVIANAPDANTEAYKAENIKSVALGPFSYADESNVVSVGNDRDSYDKWLRVTTNTDNSTTTPSTTAPFWEKRTVNYPSMAKRLKRRVINVAHPIKGNDAATKGYVDANTSNAFTATVTGMLATVDDAWTCAPLWLRFNGMSSQDGTPSVDNPIDVQVVTAPVVKVSGADQSKAESVAITLPDEHPYLASLPDGTADQVTIDDYGNVTLSALVGKTTTAATDGITATVGTDALSSTGTLADGATVYYALALSKNYSLGKIDLPALKKDMSKVWVDSELGRQFMIMTYKRDINKLPIASTTNRGTVKVGHGLDVSDDGTLWVTDSSSLPMAPTVTVRTSEKKFAVTDSPADVASHKEVMPVFDCGGYYSTFGGHFYLDLKNSYDAGTKIHIELDVVWQETHICSATHRVAVVTIEKDAYTIPFSPSMYRDTDYDWYYWSFDVPVTTDVPAKKQIHVHVF